MKIFILGINYSPELTGIAVYNTEMCEYLTGAGHKIIVFTGFPYYPQWRVEERYRKKLFITENCRGVKIRRSYLYVPPKVTPKTRILHELSFIISSFLNLLFSGCPDIVIVVSPPLLLGISAYIVSKLKKVPFIFHIQDLQPDAAVKLGMIKKGKFINILYKIERFIYKKASLVSVIGPGMRERVISKGVPEEKVILFPNWVDTDFIVPLSKRNRFRQMYGLDNKFVVLYAGNIGVKQGLEIILDVASLMENIKDITFLIVGDGAQKRFLVKKAKELKLANARFLSPQPREFLPEMLSAADISLVIQRAAVIDFAMPSKLLGILASGRTAVVSVDEKSELSKVVKKANCAIIVQPGDAIQLRDAVLKLYKDPEKRQALGENGRRYTCKYLSKDKILPEFEKELSHVIKI